jgi:hypothetical protein
LTPQQIAKQAGDTYAALSSYSDSGTAVTESGSGTSRTTFNIRLQRPDLYRIDWTHARSDWQTGKPFASKGAVWSDGYENYRVAAGDGQKTNAEPQTVNGMQQALAYAGAVSGSGVESIPATFFNQGWGDDLGAAAMGRSELKREGDEQVDGVGCYVFSSRIDSASFADHGKLPNNMGKAGIVSTTFWIGKRDHFIRQIRTISEGMSVTLPPQTDANIKAILEAQNKPATPEAIAAWRTQMDTMMKQAQGTKFVFTQTHENISVDQTFSSLDFNP